jgi:uncharacterized protein YbgA (DUF1722 family)/uncharacterized protein YbbK (DUF523 family)
MNQTFPKPRIVVSRCLGFDICRYDGEMITDYFVEAMKPFADFLPICPEMECGLGVPRNLIQVVHTGGKRVLFQPATERDVTPMMNSFISSYLNSLESVDGFILKNRSPSCGLRDVKIYSSKKLNSVSCLDAGFFGRAVIERFHGIPAEDGDRLMNLRIREHFLTAVFTLAQFRLIERESAMDALVDFHSRFKYLLMALNEKLMRILGKIVANHEHYSIDRVIQNYREQLELALSKPGSQGAMINALMHGFGGISNRLSADEKQSFLNSLKEYRNERIPRSVVLRLLQSWGERFEKDYLLNQAVFNPFPLELMALKDSDKNHRFIS